MKPFPFYRQLDFADCGPTCLRMITSYYGKHYSLEEIMSKTHLGRQGISLLNLSTATENLGFRSEAVIAGLHTLQQDVTLPCIAHWRDRHYVVIYRITSKYIYVSDPATGKLRYTYQEFLSGWQNDDLSIDEPSGVLLVLEPSSEFYEQTTLGSTKSSNEWSFLLPFFRPYHRYLAQLLLSVIAVSLIQLVFPFLAQSLVDEGIRNQNLHFVYIILIGQLVLFISQTVGEVIRSYLLLYVGNRVSISLLSSFLQKMMQLPQSFFEQRNLGDLFQRISDNQRIEDFLTAQSLNVLFSVFSISIFSIVLAYYNSLIFLIFIIGAALYMGWILLLARKRKQLEYKRFETFSQHLGQLHDLIYGMPEIRLNGSQRRRRWRWESVRIKQHQVDTETLSVDQLQERGGMFIHELKNIGITFLAAVLVIQGEMTLGMLIAVQYIIGQMNSPLLNLIDFFRSAQDAQLSIARLREVLQKSGEDSEEAQIQDKLPPGDLRIENLTFHYEGPHSPAVLNDISVTIPQGKVTAIVGASGSGKTTLLKLLLKYYSPIQGYITIGSQKLDKLPSANWLSQCGVVMQEGFIFDDTILANITESDSQHKLDKERLAHAVRIAYLESFIDSLPKGFSTQIGKNGMGLSGGQRQRMLIARAIYKNPTYLFFDEATSALDAASERYIVNNLENFYQDRTVIIIAHRLSTVKHADQILVMDQGKIVEQGTHHELTYQKGVYYTLVKNQLELGE